MPTLSGNLKLEMEGLIAAEIGRLISKADVYIFALYDPTDPTDGLRDYRLVQREKQPGGVISAQVNFDFEGVGVWYICRREGDTFTVRHIMTRISNGRFVDGQVGSFEGYWDEFPRYITEDKWVKSFCAKPSANDPYPSVVASRRRQKAAVLR
jgi:hypothetical protein